MSGESVVLAALARKRADRVREAQLDEQSRAARDIASVQEPGHKSAGDVTAKPTVTRTITVCAACGVEHDPADPPEPRDQCPAHGVELTEVELTPASEILGPPPSWSPADEARWQAQVAEERVRIAGRL